MPTDYTDELPTELFEMYSRQFILRIQYKMNKSKSNQKGSLKRGPKKAKSAAPSRQGQQRQQQKAPKVMQSIAASYYAPTGPRKPSIRNGSSKGDARIVVSHSEYLGTVAGSVAFSVASYAVNPGLSATFPWLSQMAPNYECYRFNRLKFSFKTLKGSSAVGSILMAIDYDAADSAPVNYQTMTNYNHSIDSQVWSPNTCMVCDRADLDKVRQRYIRSGAIASNLDIKTYDVGNFFIASTEMADSTNVGRLWVEYEVELITPQSVFAFPSLQSAKVVGGGTVSKTAVLGSVPVITGGLSIAALNNTITFNQTGEFLVFQNVVGVGLGANNAVTGTATITELYTQYSGLTVACEVNVVRVTEIGQTMIFDYSSSGTSISASITRIAPYAYSTA